MNGAESEKHLFAEKDRIYGMFSDIARSLSGAFFDPHVEPDRHSDIAVGDVLQHVLDYTRKSLKAEKCALFLDDRDATILVLERVSGDVDFAKLKDIATYDLRQTGPGSGVTPWVYRRRQSFNARNFDELRHNSEGFWKGNWDSPMYGGQANAKERFKCVYMAPLLAGDRAIGVIKYENRWAGTVPCHFAAPEERLIDMIAALLTNLVISQRIERNRYDHVLPGISTALVAHFDKPSSYENLLETCRSILSADICSLFLVNDDDLCLECIVGVDESNKEDLRDVRYENYRSAKGLTPWILTKTTPFNVRSYPDLQGRSEGHHLGLWDQIVYQGRPSEFFKSLYSVPLIIGDQPIGVFKVENKNVPPYYFTESDERLFDLIGRLIAVGVLYAKTREHEQYLLQMARNLELGFLAAGISHEFNNYLQRMLDKAVLAKDCSTEEPVRRELDRMMKTIAEAGEVIRLFSSMRDTSSGATEVCLDDIVNCIIGLSKERFSAHSVKIGYRNSGVPSVHLNVSEVQSILINLVNNAFDAVAECSERPGKVEITVRPDQGDRFIIEVADSGPGIPPKVRGLLFAPFFSTKRAGMGIGLYLVQRLVNNIGGQINTQSPNDLGGATFSVNLPRQVRGQE